MLDISTVCSIPILVSSIPYMYLGMKSLSHSLFPQSVRVSTLQRSPEYFLFMVLKSSVSLFLGVNILYWNIEKSVISQWTCFAGSSCRAGPWDHCFLTAFAIPQACVTHKFYQQSCVHAGKHYLVSLIPLQSKRAVKKGKCFTTLEKNNL